MTRKTTVVHAILIYPEDWRRWRRLIGKSESSKLMGSRLNRAKLYFRLGLRVYLKDRYRWNKIIKKVALEDKIAADVFKEILDLAERIRPQLKDKKVADIFKYLLDLYEREMVFWGKG